MSEYHTIKGLCVFVILALVSELVYSQTIDTPSSTETVAQGGLVQFECHVNNIGADQQVIWKFVDHNLTISTGTELQGDKYNSRYSIIQLQDVHNYWNLQISDVKHTDAGTYRCYVKGMEKSVSVLHHLVITDAPTPSPAVDIDITDCCVANGVETCALPVCRTATPMLDLEPIFANGSCIDNNILKILSCGQDGRNHMGCCIRSEIPTLCVNLCDGWGEVDGTDYRPCIQYSANITNCFKEGHASIPSQPTSVSAVASGDSILVSWKPPLENANMVDHYKVQYKQTDSQEEYQYMDVEKDRQFVSVGGLLINVEYDVKVIAVGVNGASQPSYTITISTREPVPPFQLAETLQACCQHQNVSSACIDYCDPTFMYSGIPADRLLPCYNDVNTILKCLLNHGDHRPCCSRVNVPDTCLTLCEGNFIMSYELASCLPYSPLISACVEEGSGSLPSPPKNTHIVAGSVTAASAIVAWEKPTDFGLGYFFRVSWKTHNHSDLDWTDVTTLGTQYKITGLEVETVYDVVVTVFNGNGSSLPELTLVLVTEGYPSIPKAFNETACCMNYGVQGNCLDICKHDLRLTDEILSKAIGCLDDIASMLWCATDGRDHTACCQREGVSSDCQGLCRLQHGVVPSIDFISCIGYKNSLSRCFDEGKGVLPYAPTELTMKKRDVMSVLLTWKSPGGPNMTSYIVEKSEDNRHYIQLPESLNTFQEVKDLTPDSMYYFRVRSKNANGTSLASSVLETFTLPLPFGDNSTENWQQLWANRSHCCEVNVREGCRQTCIAGNEQLQETKECMDTIDKMLPCSADGRDHSKCCKRVGGFPDECLPLCQGQILPQDIISALCLPMYGFVVSCFTKGQGLLPTFPQQFRVTEYTPTSISLAWEVPESNCPDQDSKACTYMVMVWEGDNIKSLVKNFTAKLEYTFTNLKQLTIYRLTVAAENKNGQSLPSPYIFQQTSPNVSTSISITQYPPNVVSNGSHVELGCAGFGNPLVSITWIRNTQQVSSTSVLTLAEVTVEDEGKYTCKVQYDDGTVQTSDWLLNIRYKPKALSMALTKSVLPGLHEDAHIKCKYKGFPDIIKWEKDGEALQGDDKYSFPLGINVDTGVMFGELIIRDVVTADYGTYMCNGTNTFGSQTISTSFANDFPGPTLPPSRPNNATFFEDCCKDEGVPADCRTSICTYTVDIHNIVTDTSLIHCLEYFEQYLTCGSDRKDHSKCCTEKAVDEYCLGFCSGRLPEYNDTLELLTCLTHAESIMECAIMGIQYIPSPPRSVSASVKDDKIIVQWELSEKNADKVEHYDVYFYSETVQKNFDSAGRHATSLTLQSVSLKKGETYHIWVIAENNHGQSHKTKTVNVTVTALTPPMPPGLDGSAVGSTSIYLNWNKPSTYVTITGYKVYYKKVTDPLYNSVPVKLTTTVLKNLQPATSYNIYVAAYGSDGEGSHDDVITILTGGTAPTETDGQSGSEKAGIAVGIVLGLVFLIAVAVVAVLLFRRFAAKKSFTPSDPVAFENPQYASQEERVSGLPGESSEGNGFGYGQLREEQDHENENPYLTVNSGHTPATLPISDNRGFDNPAVVTHDEA